jgi:hypothetical protein
MRFAVIHCRNSECGQHVWVPRGKIGSRGRCPHCGQLLTTPSFVPEDELVEGPQILMDIDEVSDPLGVTGDRGPG